MALKILDFPGILLDQVVPSHLEDLAFLVGQVLQEVLTYPCPGSLGLLSALFRLSCLVAPSIHLSLEVLGLPWDPLCIFRGVLFLQGGQAALDPLVVHQALQFLEFQGDLEIQGVQFLHFPQNCLFLLENLVFLVLQAWLVLVLPWLLGGLALRGPPAFPLLQDAPVILFFLENLGLPWVQEAQGIQLLEVLDRRQAQEHLGHHMVLGVQGNQVDLEDRHGLGAPEALGAQGLELKHRLLP